MTIQTAMPEQGMETPSLQVLEIESAILGALMIDDLAINKLFELTENPDPGMFSKKENKDVFKAILSLHEDSMSVDLVTVSTRLRDTNKLTSQSHASNNDLSLAYLMKLSNCINSSSNISSHLKILAESYMKRKLVKNAYSIIKKCYGGEDIFSILDDSNLFTSELEGKFTSKKTRKTVTLVESYHQEINRHKLGVPPGIPTGFKNLDMVSGGFGKGEVCVIGARPSMGKTAFLLCLADNAYNQGYTPYISSLEMRHNALTQRLMSKRLRETEIKEHFKKYSSLRKKFLTDEEINILNNVMLNAYQDEERFYINDSPGITPRKLRSALIKHIREGKELDILFIDYLGLMETDKYIQDDVKRLGVLLQELKEIAREFDIPVVVLHQLNRATEEGSDKYPILKNLRGSGKIEEHADMVLFPFRGAYYNIPDYPERMLELAVAKNRMGARIPFGHQNVLKFYSEIEYNLIRYDGGDLMSKLDEFAKREAPF